MPRYARYKRYYKKVYPRKRWASNIKSDKQIIDVHNGSYTGNVNYVVCENAGPLATPTPVLIKFGRFKLKGDIRTTATNAPLVTSANAFVIYCPEGEGASADLLNRHPEYVLGWTTISMDSGNSFSLTSNLKRNLNSGDSIQLYFNIETSQTPSADVIFDIYFTIQFWTTSA